MAVLLDYEMEYDGMLLGDNTPFGISDWSGIEDVMSSSSSRPVPRGDGNIPATDYVQAKKLNLNLVVKDPETNMQTVLDTFVRTATPVDLKFKLPNQAEKLIRVDTSARVIPRNPDTKFRGIANLRLNADDPRLYSSELHSDTATPYDPSGGGTDYAKDGNTDYVGDPTAGEFVATNSGMEDAWPLVRLYGPTDANTLTGFTLQNITTGDQADFNFASSMVTDDIFTVDFSRIVTVEPQPVPYINLNGANRYGDWELTRAPFALAPGDNVIRLLNDGTSTAITVVVSWRDTWL